ncbi:DUF2388 domain-containing protein [Pseudomonas sp. TTU2014-080ASC]|jgi:uncharacterized protein (TIGR02448 family)|uniref:DUF2388 domain-containing protein n=1 Tax=Pseudomonas sp. TTU2014-080ASC TaxID=1729724 RepID=UPI000718A1E6|nr:DUF2388 domain-containing protein [Pseudomonas sp. TTU2014-080ASC]KRW60853.1 holliday junction resolvasome, helicase subunit [Pseudomonas sp. TTU2014-080ASC]
MQVLRIMSFAALVAAATSASATSLVATTDAIGRALVGTGNVTSDISSSWGDDKVVLAARDDAASFVASEGQLRGAHLEAALQHIRQVAPQLQASDAQLAQAILTL